MSDYGALNRSEKRALEEPLHMTTGYVLDFSNRTIEEFFEDEFRTEFYHEKYSLNGDSKAKRLRAIWESQSGPETARILRKLWDYRTSLPGYYRADDLDKEEESRRAYFEVVARLEGDMGLVDLGALEAFEPSDTLYELLNSIERDIRADAPQAAIDRLHLFCVKRFRHLIETRAQSAGRDEPLNSLVAKYCRNLEQEGKVSRMSIQIIRSSISVFEQFNGVRNNQSLAHDNKLLEAHEARFVFESVSSVLKFVKAVDQKFGI